ncbi:hypothetical protein N7535_009344 [Penicillium sp. DV-2018c]|nr:hypothetical protein N7535_009344 [Penicillium sp. DV-2018c]
MSRVSTLQHPSIITLWLLPVPHCSPWSFGVASNHICPLPTRKLCGWHVNNSTIWYRFDSIAFSCPPIPLTSRFLRNIASQDKFRHQVTDIVWDETLLDEVQPQVYPTYEKDREELLSDENENTKAHEPDEESGVPKWFKSVSKRIIEVMESWECHDESQAANVTRVEERFTQLSLEKRWELYLRLLRQQKEVLDDQSDLEASVFGVKQFTALRRVTITPARHGHFIIPIYPTSLTHAFPKGFDFHPKHDQKPDTACNQYAGLIDRNRWFRTAIRVLANEPNSVSELVMTSDANSYCLTSQGINCAIFNEESEEYNDFVTMLQKPVDIFDRRTEYLHNADIWMFKIGLPCILQHTNCIQVFG